MQQVYVVVELSETGVAFKAKKSANFAGQMIVIDMNLLQAHFCE